MQVKGLSPELNNNIKSVLSGRPAEIDPRPRPQTQMTLADNILHTLRETFNPVTGRVSHFFNDPVQQSNMNLLMGGPMGMAHVWHGSPHKFNKFSLGKIGTGEGAQSYGHGLYFADNPDVARTYSGMREPLVNRMSKEIGSASKKKIFEHIQKKKEQGFGKKFGTVYAEELKKITSPETVPSFSASTGELYKVDIPDNAIKKMLDLDKPVPKSVAVKVRRKMPKAFEEELIERLNADIEDLTGRELEMALTRWASESPIVNPNVIAPKDTADFFMSIDIPGLKYLDQGSRKAGKGTRNYVVFDETLPKIINE